MLSTITVLVCSCVKYISLTKFVCSTLHMPNMYPMTNIQLNMRLQTHTCSDIMGLLVGCCMAKKKGGSMHSKLR